MSNVATVSSSQSSSTGLWAEFTLTANLAVANGTSSTTATVGIPTIGSGSLFNANLPIAVTVLPNSNTAIQGGTNNGLPATLGLSNVVFTNATTLTLAFVNNSAGSVNINSGTRFLLIQNQGI